MTPFPLPRAVLGACLTAGLVAPAHATPVTVPQIYAATEAPSGHSLLTNTGSRLAEIIYDNATLAAAGIVPGTVLGGISFRATAGSGPSPALAFADWTVKIGVAANDAASAVATFADNVTGGNGGFLTVRTGALILPAGTFPTGGSPNAFAPPIGFSTPFVYTGAGQGLVVEFIHTAGNNSVFLDSFDRTSIPGIASFNADSTTATAETAQNRVSLTTTVVAFDVPEPATLALLAAGAAALASLRRRR